MSYALESVWKRREAELKSLGIEIRPTQNLIISPDRILRIGPTTTSGISRILNGLIKEIRDEKVQAQKRKQSTLF